MKLNRDSNLFKELTDNELKSIVISNFHRNTKIVESTLMKGGLFNTTYYISIDNPRKKIICRLAPEESELLYTFEKHMMAYESHLYNELTNNDIPVPTFIKYDNSKKDVCRDYHICPK